MSGSDARPPKRGEVTISFEAKLSADGKIEISTGGSVGSAAAQSLEAFKATLQTSVLFTGFKAADRARLERVAVEHQFLVQKTVARFLNYLVAGPTAGPGKLRDARAEGALILDEQKFLRLLETGELPAGE